MFFCTNKKEGKREKETRRRVNPKCPTNHVAFRTNIVGHTMTNMLKRAHGLHNWNYHKFGGQFNLFTIHFRKATSRKSSAARMKWSTMRAPHTFCIWNLIKAPDRQFANIFAISCSRSNICMLFWLGYARRIFYTIYVAFAAMTTADSTGDSTEKDNNIKKNKTTDRKMWMEGNDNRKITFNMPV